MADQYDVIVLGAGPGGYVAGIRAAQLGLKTVVVEREYIGGVCLNIGCIPSKSLLKNAEYVHTLKNKGKELGFSFDNLEVDYGVAFKRSRTNSNRLTKGIGFLFRKNGVELIEGTGKLLDANTLHVNKNDGGEVTLSGKNIIIATGARPRELPGLEFDGEKVISYIEGIMMDSLPKKVVIVGSGAIGVEFSYIWSNYGVEVTLVEILDRMLPREDPDVSAVMEKAYKKLGVDFKKKTTIEAIDKSGEGVNVRFSDGSEQNVDFVMVAASFVPNVENVGLEAAGVSLNDHGMIEIDKQMRTNVPHIYSIGDVTGELMLAHVATAMGIVAAEVIAGHETIELDYRMMPRATYSVPQVASFGYTEEEAKAAGYEINVGQFPFSANGRALGIGEKDGFVKIISDAKYGELLGAHMVGPDVAELLPELTLAQQMELTAEEIARNVHAHPTLSEVIMEAAHGVEGQPIHI
ncbi:MAG: dihydrolipoyl dehydrogenase [Ardenticatenaceae bacterium]|nr:dihydrolipoyl dehydrogenase [Ardenticatenaceae bacterium]